jgi:hypothetical protein
MRDPLLLNLCVIRHLPATLDIRGDNSQMEKDSLDQIQVLFGLGIYRMEIFFDRF